MTGTGSELAAGRQSGPPARPCQRPDRSQLCRFAGVMPEQLGLQLPLALGPVGAAEGPFPKVVKLLGSVSKCLPWMPLKKSSPSSPWGTGTGSIFHRGPWRGSCHRSRFGHEPHCGPQAGAAAEDKPSRLTKQAAVGVWPWPRAVLVEAQRSDRSLKLRLQTGCQS